MQAGEDEGEKQQMRWHRTRIKVERFMFQPVTGEKDIVVFSIFDLGSVVIHVVVPISPIVA